MAMVEIPRTAPMQVNQRSQFWKKKCIFINFWFWGGCWMYFQTLLTVWPLTWKYHSLIDSNGSVKADLLILFETFWKETWCNQWCQELMQPNLKWKSRTCFLEFNLTGWNFKECLFPFQGEKSSWKGASILFGCDMSGAEWWRKTFKSYGLWIFRLLPQLQPLKEATTVEHHLQIYHLYSIISTIKQLSSEINFIQSGSWKLNLGLMQRAFNNSDQNWKITI